MGSIDDLKRWHANGVPLSIEQLKILVAHITTLEAENAELTEQMQQCELTEELLREQIGWAKDLVYSIKNATRYTTAKEVKHGIQEALDTSLFEY